MNQAILKGRLTTDPKISTTTTNGKDTTTSSFVLAVPDKTYRNSKGNYDTDFIRIVAFNNKADIVSKHLRKGSEIIVQGKFHSYSYTKDSQTIYGTEIIVTSIEFVSDCMGSNDFSFMDSVDDEELPFK